MVEDMDPGTRRDQLEVSGHAEAHVLRAKEKMSFVPIKLLPHVVTATATATVGTILIVVTKHQMNVIVLRVLEVLWQLTRPQKILRQWKTISKKPLKQIKASDLGRLFQTPNMLHRWPPHPGAHHERHEARRHPETILNPLLNLQSHLGSVLVPLRLMMGTSRT